MKIKKHFIAIIVLSLFLFNCQRDPYSNFYDAGIAFELEVAKELEQKYDLVLSSYSLNTKKTIHDLPVNNIMNFHLFFHSKASQNLESARKLLITCIEYLLNAANKNEKIIQFLRDYPVTEKNVFLGVSFREAEVNMKEQVMSCFLGYSTVYFEVKNSATEETFLLEETYEEALEKIKNEN